MVQNAYSPEKYMRIRRLKNRRGVVLILAFIIMITLIVIMGAFMYMTSIQIRTAGYSVSDAKALWIAEGGIQQVLYRLKNDAGFRSNPTTMTVNLGDGIYTVAVTKAGGSTYYINSLGTVGGLNRRIRQTAVIDGGGAIVPQKDWNEVIPAV